MSGHSSRTEYAVPQAQVEAIVRITAYHRKEFDQAIISFPPHEHDTIANSISFNSRDATSTFSLFGKLPPELVRDICLQLDITSLFRFRQTSLRLKQTIDSLYEYQVITSSSLSCLCALLRTEAGYRVTLSQMYQRLCEQRCSICEDNYGDLVYLLTFTRCCSACVRKKVLEVSVIPAAAATDILQLSRETVKVLSFTTLPGVYSMEEKPWKAGVQVVDSQSAISASPPGSEFDTISSFPDLTYMVCCALPNYDPRTKQIQNGLSCTGCRLAVEEDVTANETKSLLDARDMVYSMDDFLEHFKWCERAQALWASSECGTIEPLE